MIRKTTVLVALTASLALTGCNSQDQVDTTSTATSTTSTSAPAPSSGTGGTENNSTTGSSDAGAKWSADQARSALAQRSGSSAISVVPIKNGYAGATLGANDEVSFWHSNGSTWTPDGKSKHPEVVGSEKPTIKGTMLYQAAHPIFVVEGEFTGNGTGQALMFGKSESKPWGVMVASDTSDLVPSGAGYDGQGLELAIDIEEEGIRTESLWGPGTNASFAEQKAHPNLRTWKASVDRLVMKGSNQFRATIVENAAPAKPATSTDVPDGTWYVNFKKFATDGDFGAEVTVLGKDTSPNCTNACLETLGDKTFPFSSDDAVVSLLLKDSFQTITAPAWAAKSLVEDDVDPSTFNGSPYLITGSQADRLKPQSDIYFAAMTIKDGRIVKLESLYHP